MTEPTPTTPAAHPAPTPGPKAGQKPVLFTVDDDPEVLRAVHPDLPPPYRADFPTLRAISGGVALEAAGELKAGGGAPALLLVDQRMPQMSGVELLQKAIPLFPDAKRVLLTAYADMEAAIQAINSARVDFYL